MEGIPFLATGLSAGAIFLFFQYWRIGGRRYALGALIALVGAGAFWIYHSGPEFGVVFAMLGVIAAAALCVLWNSTKQPAKTVSRRQTDWTYDRGSYRQLTAELAVVAILAPLSAAGLLLALVHLLPWTMASKMALAALVFPLLWALLALAYRLLNRSWRYLGLLALMSSSTLGLYYGY